MTQAKKAKKQASGKDIAFNIFLYALCILILIIIAYPLYFIIIASFSNPSEVAQRKCVVLAQPVYRRRL